MTIDLTTPQRIHGPACATCSGPTRLIGVEPHPVREHMDLRTFACISCEGVQTTVVPIPN